MDKNTLTKLSQDKEFIQRLLNQDNDEGFRDVLREKGVNVSLDEAKEIRMQVDSALKGDVNLTDEELEAINAGKGATVGDAIKYTVKTAVVLMLVAGISKFGIDVAGNVKDKMDNPISSEVKDLTGIGKNKSTYGRAVGWTADAVMSVIGGKGEKSRYTKDVKRITGQEERSEAIVKGFGLKNGKLF